MKEEKKAFSERLRAAMREAGLDPRPSKLEKEFNRLYLSGQPASVQPITSQAVSGWLGARAIPKQDKLRVLAKLLKVEPHYLRYGGPATQGVREPRAPSPVGISANDRATIEALLALPPEQRKLVGELIRALANRG